MANVSNMTTRYTWLVTQGGNATAETAVVISKHLTYTAAANARARAAKALGVALHVEKLVDFLEAGGAL